MKPKLPHVNFKDDLSPYIGKNKFSYTKASDCAEILISKKGTASRAPGIVMKLFKKAADEKGDQPALESVEGKIWTWKQYHDDVLTCAKSMINLGFKQFDSCSIIGFNSPQWVIANMAAIAAGGKAAGMYTTSSADAVEYIVTHSESSVCVCEDEEQLNKFLVNIKKMPLLKHIVVYKGAVKEQTVSGCRVWSWENFMKNGESVKTDTTAERIANTKPGNTKN